MAEEKKELLSAPIPLHWEVEQNNVELINKLRQELAHERQKFANLRNELAEEQRRTQHLEFYISTLLFRQKQGIPKVDSLESLATVDTLNEDFDDRPQIGSYPPHIRAEKIRRYKAKRRQYHKKVNVSRKFKGRSNVAKLKPRVRGKFVSSSKQTE